MENFTERTTPAGLYDSRFEHDNCGIGAVVDIKGRKSHRTLDDALQIVEHLEPVSYTHLTLPTNSRV